MRSRSDVALGATRAQITRQLLIESSFSGFCGGFLSLLIAQWSLVLFAALSPVDLTSTHELSLSYPVLGFTGAISILTALACGTVAAWSASRPDVQQALVEGGRQIGGNIRHRRLRHAFVVAEIALAVVLLVGAGLMLRSFAAMREVDPGFDPHHVLTMRHAIAAREISGRCRADSFFPRSHGADREFTRAWRRRRQ